MIIILLLSALGIASLYFTIRLVRTAIAQHALVPRAEAVVLGAVTNFFDTLGIGSFAPSMAWFKFRALVADRQIPATLIAGHSLPTITQSAIFLVLLGVQVDPLLLVGCLAGMGVGAWLGLPLVSRLPLRVVQGFVGVALLLAALLYAMANLKLMPLGGEATSLPLGLMLVAIAAHVVMGVLTNFGIGSYAPTLVMLSLMGMDPRLVFPIMASASALSLLVIGGKKIDSPEVNLKVAIGMVLGGIPAVLIAAFVVKEMPLETLRWMVVVVVLYAALLMLRSAAKPAPAELAEAA